jgi:predicted transposase YbfD/YdcC
MDGDEIYGNLFWVFYPNMRALLNMGLEYGAAMPIAQEPGDPGLAGVGQGAGSLAVRDFYRIAIINGSVHYSKETVACEPAAFATPLALRIAAQQGDQTAIMLSGAIQGGAACSLQLGDTKASLHGRELLLPYHNSVSFDGRVSRGSARERHGAEEDRALNTLDICLCDFGCNIGQVTLGSEKKSEISATELAIKTLHVIKEGDIYLCDALNTQKKIIDAVIAMGARYACPVKSNHKTLYGDLKESVFEKFMTCGPLTLEPGWLYFRTYDRVGLERVIHEYVLVLAPEGLYGRLKWKNLAWCGIDHCTTFAWDAKPTLTNRFYICSAGITIEDFARVSRSHWSVENNVHWPLDAIFMDDACRTKAKNGSSFFQAIRKLGCVSIGFLKKYCLCYSDFSYDEVMQGLSFDASRIMCNPKYPASGHTFDNSLGIFGKSFLYGNML